MKKSSIILGVLGLNTITAMLMAYIIIFKNNPTFWAGLKLIIIFQFCLGILCGHFKAKEQMEELKK